MILDGTKAYRCRSSHCAVERAKKDRDRVKQNKNKYDIYLEKARSRVKKIYGRKSGRERNAL